MVTMFVMEFILKRVNKFLIIFTRNDYSFQIVNFQTNLGVKYGYALPLESNTPAIAPPLLKRPSDSGIPEPRRLDTPLSGLSQRDEARPIHRRTRLRRRFAWKISGVSACSKSCGGGKFSKCKFFSF